jgi:hypothetical protein
MCVGGKRVRRVMVGVAASTVAGRFIEMVYVLALYFTKNCPSMMSVGGGGGGVGSGGGGGARGGRVPVTRLPCRSGFVERFLAVADCIATIAWALWRLRRHCTHSLAVRLIVFLCL